MNGVGRMLLALQTQMARENATKFARSTLRLLARDSSAALTPNIILMTAEGYEDLVGRIADKLVPPNGGPL